MRQDEVWIILQGFFDALRTHDTPLLYTATPIGADPQASVPAGGVGLRACPRAIPVLAHPDWLEAQADRRGSDFVDTLRNQDLAVVIHWPTVIATAFTTEVVTSRYARRALRRLRPYFQNTDPLLGELVRLSGLLPADQRFDDELLNQNIAHHVQALLETATGRSLVRALRKCVGPVEDLRATQLLGYCYGCLLRKVTLLKSGYTENPAVSAAIQCPDCEARVNFAKECSALDIKYVWKGVVLDKPRVLSLEQALKRDVVTALPPVGYDIQRILSGLSDYDGAYAEGANVRVQWGTYAQRYAELLNLQPAESRTLYARRSTALDFSSAQMALQNIVDFPEDTDSFTALGDFFRESVLRRLEKHNCVLSDDGVSTLFSRRRLELTLEEFGNSAPKEIARQKEAAERLRELGTSYSGQRVRKVIKMMWESPHGPMEVALRRMGARWRVCTVVPLEEGVELPRSVARQVPEAVLPGDYWWREADLASYARRCTQSLRHDTRLYVEALHHWFSDVLASFRRDPRTLLAAEQATRQEITKGQVARGERRHLGRFSQHEQDVVQTFCLRRTESSCEKAFRGPFSRAEWSQLEELVPYRSRQRILQCVRDLGFMYAKEHGWLAYLKSGYGVAKSAVLRTNWMLKGVKV